MGWMDLQVDGSCGGGDIDESWGAAVVGIGRLFWGRGYCVADACRGDITDIQDTPGQLMHRASDGHESLPWFVYSYPGERQPGSDHVAR